MQRCCAPRTAGTAVPTFCSVWLSLRRAMSPIVRRGFYRRQLPHLQRDYRPHFVTFCTYGRWVLPEWARQIVLDCGLLGHNVTISLYVSVVMPDHVHMIFTPLVDREVREICSLARIVNAVKGASSHRINAKRNKREGRTGLAGRVFRSCAAIIGKSRCRGGVYSREPGAARLG